jgi:hypothetical protein
LHTKEVQDKIKTLSQTSNQRLCAHQNINKQILSPNIIRQKLPIAHTKQTNKLPILHHTSPTINKCLSQLNPIESNSPNVYTEFFTNQTLFPSKDSTVLPNPSSNHPISNDKYDKILAIHDQSSPPDQPLGVSSGWNYVGMSYFPTNSEKNTVRGYGLEGFCLSITQFFSKN